MSSNHGGARPGAGRPKGRSSRKETRSLRIWASITPSDAAKLAKQLAKSGETRSDYLRRLLLEDCQK